MKAERTNEIIHRLNTITDHIYKIGLLVARLEKDPMRQLVCSSLQTAEMELRVEFSQLRRDLIDAGAL